MANIVGTSGNDTLVGTVAADSISGLAGDDTLYGQAGNDTLLGGVGNDWLLGRTGNDVLEGGAGNDVLYGGDHRDTIDKGAGNDTYKFGLGAGVDHIQDFDVTVGNTDVALFNGVASTAVSALERKGNDLVLTYSASDQLIVDAYFYPQRGNQVELFKFSNGVTWDEAAIKARVKTVGTVSNDSIRGYDDGTNRIFGLDGNDSLAGGALDDLINGGNGNDTLNGLAGNDTLNGEAGDDTLFGWFGNDVLDGGAGNDFLLGGYFRDSTIQGAGNDTYKFGLGAGVDHIQDFDVTVGNTDVALFNGVASTAVSALERRGNDLVITYSASDQLIVDAYFYPQRGNQVELFKFSNGVTWDEAAIKARVITVGTALNDSITGYDDGTNRIYGQDGNDTLVGGALDDLINGGNGHDTLYGQAGNDTLLGDVGNDWLSGGAGDDTLNGGVGDDYMDAGLDTDTVSYTSATAGVMVDLGLITAQNTVGAGIDTVLNFENVMGSNFNDNLKGNAGNNVLNGRGGNDVLNGLAGVDTTSYIDASVGVTVNLGLTTAQNTVGAGTDTLLSIENLTGSNFNDSLTGNFGNNVLSGGKGNDTINGGSGNDTLIGGLGVDTLNGGLGNDTFDYDAVSESPVGTGRDVINGFAGAGAAIGDKIDLTTIDANSLLAGNQAFSWIGGAAFTGVGQLRYAGGVLQGSTDADTAAEFEIELVGTPALTVGGAGTDILL